VKEVIDTESCKFRLWGLYEDQVAAVLQEVAFSIEEEEFR